MMEKCIQIVLISLNKSNEKEPLTKKKEDNRRQKKTKKKKIIFKAETAVQHEGMS